MTSRVKRLATALGSVLVAASGLVATAPAASAAGLTEFHEQDVTWSACGESGALQCATVVVPLNYRKPNAERLRVAISKLPAKNPAKRRGVLLLNPGGPGGAGLDMPEFFAGNRIAETYDLIGFDPRGVGESSPLECEASPEIGTLTSRPTDAQFADWTATARAAEAACARAAGGIRPYVNTPNTARDMDVIRAVLGEQKINYLGFSYGTYLGAVYGTLFPARLDRNVLDSSVHPEWIWREQFKAQSRAIRDNVDAFFAWVAERDSRYGFGTTAAEVFATSEELSARLAVQPWQGFVDQTTWDVVVGSNARYREIWDLLAEDIAAIRRDVLGEQVAPEVVADVVEATRALRDLGIAQTVPGVFQTVTCEADWPADLNTYYADMRRYRVDYPYGFGVLRAAPTECTFRSFKPADKVTDLKRTRYPVGLVIQAEFDPQTHYDGGPAMAARLDDALVSVSDEGTHGLYSRNACVTELVDRYLVDGVLPGSRAVCPGAPRPDVPADDEAAVTAQAEGSAGLEEQVLAFIKEKKFGGPGF
ncbi:alpha/beta fold hydrolase [Saccharothrix syringae]|uniref:Alpha/beta fold hydrolase n=1 Tax=Saccharothrix syringae TaxID=103733 RepID=A0A5Q0H1M2_SACSY|nr:alpha/beta fold hydrolase [Saccharothrix syringae]QFZ20167.1 alpha/beta fold hydrolase [Saccharothrix syringae]